MRALREGPSARVRARASQLITEGRGSVGIAMALLALPVVVSIGAATDYAVLLNKRQRLQNASDTAALSLAIDAPKLSAQAISDRANALVLAAAGDAVAKNMQVTASYDPSTHRTSVRVAGTLPTAFMKIVGASTMSYNQLSVAQAEQSEVSDVSATSVKRWPVCLMVTAPTSNHSLFASGPQSGAGKKPGPGVVDTSDAASSISLKNCMLQVNTANWDAVEADHPNAKIIGSRSEFCFHGGYIHNVKNHGTVTTTNLNDVTASFSHAMPAGVNKDEIAEPGAWDSGCPIFADPLESLPSLKATASCDGKSPSYNSTTTLKPGRYCQGITITGGTVTLAPGLYHLDGPLSISGSGTVVTGSGVAIYLNGPAARFEQTGGSLSLKPSSDPTAVGQLTGVVLYANDPSAKYNCQFNDGNPRSHRGSSGAYCVNEVSGGSFTYTGVAYFRFLPFWVTGVGKVMGDGASLIADYVATTDTGDLSISGVENASTSAQLLMMQNSQAGYTVTTRVTTMSQKGAHLVK